MSIEMENPESLLEKLDASANLVAQMMLAHRMRDEKHFNDVYRKASELLSESTTMADELDLSEEAKVEKNIKLISSFMEHCAKYRIKIKEEVFETFFNA